MAIYKNIALLPGVHSLEKLRSNKIRYSTRIFFLSFFFSFVFFCFFFFFKKNLAGEWPGHIAGTFCVCFKSSPHAILTLICMKTKLKGEGLFYEWMNGFACSLISIQWQKATRKWLIDRWKIGFLISCFSYDVIGAILVDVTLCHRIWLPDLIYLIGLSH